MSKPINDFESVLGYFLNSIPINEIVLTDTGNNIAYLHFENRPDNIPATLEPAMVCAMLEEHEKEKLKHIVSSDCLTNDDIVKLEDFCDILPAGEIKNLLIRMISDYCEYATYGSPGECLHRKDWMNKPLDDIYKSYMDTIDKLQKEIDSLKKGKA